jgi:DNA polymerase-3 subunit delta
VTVLRGDIDKFLSRPDPRQPIVLIYGPDTGLVSERTATIIRAASGDGTDPFSIVPLEGDAIVADPGVLMDEARTFGLFGNRRVIRVRAGGKNLAPALEPLIADPPQATIVIEAGELRPTSPLRSLCEKSTAAAVIPCYVDGSKELSRLIERVLAESDLAIDPDAREELIGLLGGDRLASRTEIDKLALYAKGSATIRLDDVRAVIADASALALDDVVDCAAAGEPQAALSALGKAYAAGTSPAAILSAAIRHVTSLHRLRLSVERGDSPSRAVETSRPPIFFRRKPKFERALGRFDTAMLTKELIALSEASLNARKNADLAGTIAERAILRLSYAAKQAATRRVS